MDGFKLGVGRRPSDDSDLDEREEVQIFIGGRDLREIIREVELPFAKAEGHEDIAGGYVGLPPDLVALNPRLFFGEADTFYSQPRKQMIMQCECGEEGCWPLLVRISTLEDEIRWSDFEQPNRSGDPNHNPLPRWDYSALAPFRFARKAYEHEVEGFLKTVRARTRATDGTGSQ